MKLHRSISTDELTAVGRVLAGLPPEKRAALEELAIRGERVDLEAAELARPAHAKDARVVERVRQATRQLAIDLALCSELPHERKQRARGIEQMGGGSGDEGG